MFSHSDSVAFFVLCIILFRYFYPRQILYPLHRLAFSFSCIFRAAANPRSQAVVAIDCSANLDRTAALARCWYGIGQLPPDAKVLIDDGTCPVGQLKQVVGGNVTTGQARLRSCVPRP
jgi:hypothetical protein